MHVARKLDFVTDKRNKITEFFAELRRREVFGTAAYYFAISWGGIEILEWVLERWQVTPPEWLMPLLATALVVGFPVSIRWLGAGLHGVEPPKHAGHAGSERHDRHFGG